MKKGKLKWWPFTVSHNYSLHLHSCTFWSLCGDNPFYLSLCANCLAILWGCSFQIVSFLQKHCSLWNLCVSLLFSVGCLQLLGDSRNKVVLLFIHYLYFHFYSLIRMTVVDFQENIEHFVHHKHLRFVH